MKSLAGVLDEIRKAPLNLAASQSELPSVTADDEGKVLMVDSSGNWVATELPSSDGQEET